MFKVNPLKLILTLSFVSITAAGCNGAPDDSKTAPPMTSQQGLLRYVPADTPYVFALIDPLPDEVADKFEPKLDAMLTTYQEVLRATVQTRAAEKSDAENENGHHPSLKNAHPPRPRPESELSTRLLKTSSLFHSTMTTNFPGLDCQ